MNRVQKIILFTGFAAGGILGFFSIFSIERAEGRDSVESRQERRARNFDSIRQEVISPREVKRPRDFIVRMNLYSRMSADEIKKEISRLEKDSQAWMDLDYEWIEVMKYLAYRMGVLDPQGGLEMAGSWNYNIQTLCLRSLIKGWAEGDLDAATTYAIENQKEYPFILSALLGMASTVASENPHKAIAWYSRLDPEYQKRVLRLLMESMVMDHWQELPGILKYFDARDLEKRGCYSVIAQEWAVNDWDSARKWINTLPPLQKDRALAKSVVALSFSDAEAALAAVTDIGKKEERRECLSLLIKLIPEKVHLWLEQSSLSTEEKKDCRDAYEEMMQEKKISEPD